ncbi:MAG: AzlD domain-containing protein [Candidatus Paracaedibacteraceae bacterium]|nr:AzlD domain-containing protein [Candidatus Paracaedibacteraceae bacterium]
MDIYNILLAIAVMTAITFSQKYLPFVALSSVADNRAIQYLGQKLPAGVMLILSLFTLKEAAHQGEMIFSASFGAAFFTAIIHIWFRHALLSIFGGVIIYGLLKSFLS